MSLDRSAVLLAAASYQVYSEGLELFKNNRASVYYEERTNNNFTYKINGKVIGNAYMSHYATVLAKKDSFGFGYCTCPSGSEGRLCCHRVAVALQWLKNHEDDGFFDAVTDTEFERMLDAYRRADKCDGSLQTNDKKLHAAISISLKKSMPQISLRVGYNKLYIVKKLMLFYRVFIDNGEYLISRSDFAMLGEEAFYEEDLPAVRYIIKKAETYDYTLHEREQPAGKFFDMTPSDCDEVFSLYEGKLIGISGGHEKKELPVIRKDPKIKFKVSPVSFSGGKMSGISISMEGVIRTYLGKNGVYLVGDDAIYCCSRSFSNACYELISSMENIREKGRDGLILSKKDIPSFCANILPRIRDYAEVEDINSYLDEYTPEKLDVEFYFDMPDEQTLTCQVKYMYGEKQINPLYGDYTGITRDELTERKAEGLMGKYFRFKDSQNGILIQDDENQIFSLLDSNFSEFMSLGSVYVTDAIKGIHISHPPKVTVGVNIKGNLLDLKVDADGLSGEELRELLGCYREKRHFFRLKNGDYIHFKDEDYNDMLSSVGDLIDGLRLKNKDVSNGVSLPKNRAFYINEVLGENEHIDKQVNDVYRNIIRSLEPGSAKRYDIPEGLCTELRGYQVDGYEWLMSLNEYGFGGILADDMGLGKTVQIIAMLLSCKKEGSASLVCCPASLVYNWFSEVSRFAPSLKCQIVSGDQDERRQIISSYQDFDVLITSYDILRRDIEYYSDCNFAFQIVDEAQFIKNQNTKKAHAVKEIHADTKFALTGTPIENRLSELWSIFDYLMPGYLYSYQMFKAVIETPIVKEHKEEPMERLHKLIAPFILRRLKKDVLKDLPDKLEEIVYSQMEGEQKQLYAAVTARLVDSLNDASDSSYNTGKIEILAELTRLRQLCCDPALIYENYTAGSVKLEACMQLVEQGIDGGHKLLIFSQFTSMLDIIAKRLSDENISFFMLTGETPAKSRQSMVDTFQVDDTPVFLISLKAGGTGLNLTAADIVIHYDPWWNIAVQNQATDRSHRIGQENTVNVYKLVVKDTIEDKILALQEAKKQLADDILSGEQTSIASLGREELLELLK